MISVPVYIIHDSQKRLRRDTSGSVSAFESNSVFQFSKKADRTFDYSANIDIVESEFNVGVKGSLSDKSNAKGFAIAAIYKKQTIAGTTINWRQANHDGKEAHNLNFELAYPFYSEETNQFRKWCKSIVNIYEIVSKTLCNL